MLNKIKQLFDLPSAWRTETNWVDKVNATPKKITIKQQDSANTIPVYWVTFEYWSKKKREQGASYGQICRIVEILEEK